jgi:hypothetical protein
MGFFGGVGGGTTYSDFVGASTGTAGTAGLVPAPALGKNTRYLSSNATFGELPLLPQYKNTTAARYINQVVDGYTGGAGAPTIKVRYFALMYVPADGQVDVLAFRTNTAPSPAFNVHLALWQVNEDGTVGSYVIGGTGSTGTTGGVNINISVSATNIFRGYYWMSFTSDATGSASAIGTNATQSSCFYTRFLGGTSVAQQSFVIWNYTCATSYDQTTHETFLLSQPSGTGLALPQMAFQYV